MTPLVIQEARNGMHQDTYKAEKPGKSEHFEQECAAWLRLLDFLKQENSFLKTRLSVVVDHKTDREFLNEAEHFQNLFIIKDEYIREIAKDAKMHNEKLKQAILLKKDIEDKLIRQQQKLRNEMDHLEKEFIRMKNDFNKKLLAVI